MVLFLLLSGLVANEFRDDAAAVNLVLSLRCNDI